MKKQIICCMLAVSLIFGTFPIPARADTIIPVQTVEDAVNTPYASTTTNLYTIKDTALRAVFNVPKSGIVKIVARGQSKDLTGTMWISSDNKGLSIIGKSGDIKQLTYGSYQPGIAQGELISYLESGTYYINYMVSAAASSFGVGVLFEDANSEETVNPSSYARPNPLVSGKLSKGFLSYNNPIDTYSLKLKTDSYVEMEYYCDDNNLQIGLYNENQGLITKTTIVENTSEGNSGILKKMLKKGNYFLVLSNAKGRTQLKATVFDYSMTLYADKKKLTNQNVTISVDTIKNYSSLQWAEGNVPDADPDDSLWSNRYNYDSEGNSVYVDHNIYGNKFKVSKNGIYSVRAVDENGNKIIRRIQITVIDKDKPITNVKTGGIYKKNSVIRFNDQSGIKSSTLNGKKIKNKYKITKAGKYTLKVTDKAGNLSKVTFQIK